MSMDDDVLEALKEDGCELGAPYAGRWFSIPLGSGGFLVKTLRKGAIVDVFGGLNKCSERIGRST